MPDKSPPRAVPSYSANDNGPLSPGQVKALKIAIAIMGAMIVAALIAIVARVIYLSTTKKTPAQAPAAAIAAFAPKHDLALPRDAAIKTMSLDGNRLLVHYVAPQGSGAVVLDLATGRTLSQVRFTEKTGAER